MKNSTFLLPLILGLFDKRVAGDEGLLELARRRFQAAGMGAEMHAGTPEQLEGILKFRPSPETPVMVHLARDLHLLIADSRRRILRFAGQFAGRIQGLVLHDHPGMVLRPEEFIRAAREMALQLRPLEACPMLFIEYATGLEPDAYARCFATIRDLDPISACIDIGHLGIRQVRQAYAQIHQGADLEALKQQNDRLPHVMAEVQTAVQTALPAVLELVAALGALGKPVHFHLHDGHPLSTANPLGIADHLSFLRELPLSFEYRGRRSVPLMYGPSGLSRLVAHALSALGSDQVSFTLEIHPTTDRLELGEAAPLFGHWRDITNAELMNHWLAELSRNHTLLRAVLQEWSSLP